MKMKVVAWHQHKNSLHFPALPGPGGSIPARFRSGRGEFILASGTASFETARAIRFAARAAAATFLLLSFLAAAPAHAQISVSGDVVPGSAVNPVWDPGEVIIGNTGTGTLTISTGGTLITTSVENGNSIGNGVGSTGTVTVNGGAWDATGYGISIGNDGAGSLNLTAGTVDFFDVSVGAGSTGTGTVNLTGGTLTAGQLSEGSGNGTVTFNGGTLRLFGNQNNLFSGFEAGDVILTNSGGTIDTQAFAVATALGLTGNGGLTKTGTGTLTLSGSNSYTGSTTVNSGRLNVNGSIVGNATVASGGTLGGNGTIGSNLTVSGTQAPGTSPGIQTVGGNLTYTNGSAVVEWELEANAIGLRGTNFDGINVGGNLDFAGATTLALDFGVNVDWSNAFWNTDVTGTNGWLIYDVDGLTTQLANLSLSAPSTWLDSSNVALNIARPGASFGLVQSGSDIYVSYTAVPEPSTYALLAAGLALLALVRRRRA